MSIKKVLITFLAFNFVFANSLSRNTFAMKRNRECIEVANTVEVPRKRICANDAHQSKDEDDIDLAKSMWENLSKSEIKKKLLSGYKELSFNCDLFLLNSQFESLKINSHRLHSHVRH